jgi:putative ABC transport system ATP-binding protein
MKQIQLKSGYERVLGFWKKSMIQLTNVGKTYQRGTREISALQHITLQIEKGEFIIIMGPSGSGKSTLLHLIGGLDQPSTGEIYIDNTPLHRISDEALTIIRRKRVGFIFQFFNLLPTLSAFENISLPLLIDGHPLSRVKDRVIHLLDQMGLGDRIDHRPAELSGGEMQRVAICRALVAEPAVLLADEPTGNLDSRAGEDIFNLLKTLNQNGQTIVMVTHNPLAATYGTRLITLKDGVLVSDTPIGRGNA